MKTWKILLTVACLTLIVSCGASRKTMTTTVGGIEMTVSPERNGGAPQTLELTIKNNTGGVIQFGADYSIERLVGGKWIAVDLGNFAVIAIMYGIQPSDTGKYTISLFTEQVKYPEGDYRVVKQVNIGENESRPYYANFKIIEPR